MTCNVLSGTLSLSTLLLLLLCVELRDLPISSVILSVLLLLHIVMLCLSERHLVLTKDFMMFSL